MYKLTREQFYSIKKEIDGHVFWRISEPFIIILQISPDQYITYLLNKFKS